MALYIQKPIFWNMNQYIKPSGARATSGFPKERGYGHEEWNNSRRMILTRRGQKYHVFHTEGIGTAPIAENVGQTFVFMTASHHGIQQLVGVAGSATGLFELRKDREAIISDLGLQDLWSDSWSQPIVRERHANSKRAFLKHWRADLHWIPNWICSHEHFLWLSSPITLDARHITGKNRLLSMFSSHTLLNEQAASRIMNSIPTNLRGDAWRRISEAMEIAPTTPSSIREAEHPDSPITDVITQIAARRGQGRFRDDVLSLWNKACSVTGLDCQAALRASHVKPWHKASSREKLDPRNGLILSATLDALFDAGLISFQDDGTMLVSSRLSKPQRELLGLPMSLLARPSAELRRYLQHHRSDEFKP